MMYFLILSGLLSWCMATVSWFYGWWFTLFCLMNVFYNDAKTYYISPMWMLVCLSFLLIWQPIYWDSFVVFLFPVLIMKGIKKDWIGWADVFFIGLFALILGWQRMVVCMFLSVFCGFVYCLFFPKRLIPFVSCLCIGFVVSFWRGFLIYGILMV